MALSITHATVVVTADDGTSEVGSDEWNAAHTLTGAASVAQGGTGLTSGTSGGIPYFSAANAMTSSAALTANAIVFGGGAGATPYTGAGWSWDDTNRSLTLTGATVTTSKPVLDLSQTWNAGAVTFTGIKLNITDTTSAAASLLLDLQVGGSSKATIDKDGRILLGQSAPWGTAADCDYQIGDAGRGMFSPGGGMISLAGNNTEWLRCNADSGKGVSVLLGLGIAASGSISTPDVWLYRDAAAVLAQRNSTTAQTLRVYNTYTDSSNYERAVFDWTTSSNVLTVGAQNGGTGTLRKVQIVGAGVLTNATVLPSTNPGVAGQLWNNSNVVTVSTG